jgi:hypothetical protein
VRNEIANQSGEIGLRSTRAFSHVRSEVHVAYDGDPKPRECFRQSPQANADPLHDGSMGFEEDAIDDGEGA